MERFKITRKISVIIVVLFMGGCTNEGQYLTVNELTKQNISDIISVNFLSEYGGIEKEREWVCSKSGELSACETDTLIGPVTVSGTGFNMDMFGNFSVSCKDYTDLTYQKFYRYNGESLISFSEQKGFLLQIQRQSDVTIAENIDNKIYSTYANSLRNLTFLSDRHKNLYGSLSLRSNSCTFNFDDCKLTEKSEYIYYGKLSDKKNNDYLTLKGTIKKINDVWTAFSEDGIEYVLN